MITTFITGICCFSAGTLFGAWWATKDGAPLRDGLSQQAAEPEVSALRVSIPGREIGA